MRTVAGLADGLDVSFSLRLKDLEFELGPGHIVNKSENPYTPGAGRKPPTLAGRDRDLENFASLIERLGGGGYERSLVYSGLRGVAETVPRSRSPRRRPGPRSGAADRRGSAQRHCQPGPAPPAPVQLRRRSRPGWPLMTDSPLPGWIEMEADPRRTSGAQAGGPTDRWAPE